MTTHTNSTQRQDMIYVHFAETLKIKCVSRRLETRSVPRRGLSAVLINRQRQLSRIIVCIVYE